MKSTGSPMRFGSPSLVQRRDDDDADSLSSPTHMDKDRRVADMKATKGAAAVNADRSPHSSIHNTPRSSPDHKGERDSRKVSKVRRPSHGTSSFAGDFEGIGKAKNFKVVVRVRPPLPRELSSDKDFANVMSVNTEEHEITISENLEALRDGDGGSATAFNTHTFTFDHVYDQNSDQLSVYSSTAQPVVDSSLMGYNATIFAYGQTGTGKTFTMEGFNSAEERGIIPRAIEQIFVHIQNTAGPRTRFLVRASYLQIYNEVISDLLKSERTNLSIRENKKKGVYVEGLSEWVVRSPREIYGLMEKGGAMRATGSTKMNEMSSRSHAVFIIIVEQSETVYTDADENEISAEEFHKMIQANVEGSEGLDNYEKMVHQSFRVGKLNLVDLAGSERVRLTGATGQRLEESKKINQSLSALGNVIAALTDPRGRQHIPYRDSKLTRILEDSLGGNCKTTMMAMVSPALEAFVESLSTLKFANRAKNIKNEAKVNEDKDQKSLLRQYERELRALRAELQNRSANVVSHRALLELEEQRRRAEEDKMEAIRALEVRSVEMMHEKEEKRRLEERIAALQSQMLTGEILSDDMKDTPAFRIALKEHQDRIREQYDERLAELEKERESIEEEKAQVDRYKLLLLKQRDIMIALTQRLNERDEQIMSLQDELDAYDRHQKELEEKLDERTASLIHLQRVALEHNTTGSPTKNQSLQDALGSWAGTNKEGKPSSDLPSRGGTSAPPQLLITYKQYRPFGDPIIFSEDGVANGGETFMLSAEEKILELSRIVEAQTTETDKLSKELEEVQTEKVSMEYLLRERLEKLVQIEIEARLDGMNKDPVSLSNDLAKARIAALQKKVEDRDEELKKLEVENKQLLVKVKGPALRDGGREGSGKAPDIEARLQELMAQHAQFRAEATSKISQLEMENSSLKKLSPLGGVASHAPSIEAELNDVRSENRLLGESVIKLSKERKAIQTIFEKKIKSLLDNISATAEVYDRDGSNPRLIADISALQRLVNASVTALKNSDAKN